MIKRSCHELFTATNVQFFMMTRTSFSMLAVYWLLQLIKHALVSTFCYSCLFSEPSNINFSSHHIEKSKVQVRKIIRSEEKQRFSNVRISRISSWQEFICCDSNLLWRQITHFNPLTSYLIIEAHNQSYSTRAGTCYLRVVVTLIKSSTTAVSLSNFVNSFNDRRVLLGI